MLCVNYGGFPGGSVIKNMPANAGDMDSTSESGRVPGGGNGNPLQYSCLDNPMDRVAWRAAVWGRIEWNMTERLPHSLENKIDLPSLISIQWVTPLLIRVLMYALHTKLLLKHTLSGGHSPLCSLSRSLLSPRIASSMLCTHPFYSALAVGARPQDLSEVFPGDDR